MKTEPITITVQLPPSLHKEARKVAEESPQLMTRIVLYGITRKGVFDRMMESGN